jgi:hypothetical protein
MITKSVFGLNEERFWLGGAADKSGRGREAVGSAPVSQKRVGLKRRQDTAMGIAAAIRRWMSRADVWQGKLVPTLWQE